jgi:hypothetical protein
LRCRSALYQEFGGPDTPYGSKPSRFPVSVEILPLRSRAHRPRSSYELQWSPWRDTALCLGAEAYLLAGDPDRAIPLFIESSAVAVALGNADCLVVSESELALLAIDHGYWARAAEHVDRALTAVDEHRMHDYAASLLASAAAARLALRRGRPHGSGAATRPRDAGPSLVHVRAAVLRRPGTAAAGQGVLEHGRARDRPASAG